MPVLRDGWRRLPGLSSFPLPYPSIVPNIPGRLTSGSGLAARGRGDAWQRNLRNRPRSGFLLFQSPLPGEEGLWELASCDLDRSHLNEFIHLTPFMMVTVASVLLSVREGDFLASLDLKDAYLQIPIPYSLRKLWGSRRRGWLPVRRPVFRTLDRSPGRHYGLRQRMLTRTGSDFSGIWTTSWFLPPRSRQPNRRSSPFSRFVAPLGL